MKFILLAVVLALPQYLCAPTLKRAESPVVKGSYIVVLKSSSSRTSHIQKIQSAASSREGSPDYFDLIYDNWSVLNGYAANLGSASLERVLSDPNVDYVEENGIVTIDTQVMKRSQGAQIPNSARSLQSRAGTAEGVDIYSIDTGVYVDHVAFGGRAKWGKSFGGYADADGHGHGTHTMGIAAGQGYGPATSANIIAVKVLSDWGSGAWADVISGINWVADTASKTGRPSVTNMSLGGSSSDSVDAAVAAAVALGIHFTVAAGNSDIDADNFSPARVPTAVTVGAIDVNKEKAYFSNYGPVLDVWYNGVDVLSTWIGAPDATQILSGTSMAAPGVAGILAVEIGAADGSQSPADLASTLTKYAVPDVIGAPNGTTTLRAVQW